MALECRDLAHAAPFGPDTTRPVLLKLDGFGAKSVLDLACGQGWLTAALARCGFDAQGLDTDAARVDAARLAHPDLTFHHATASAPAAVRERFDAVVGLQLRAAAPATDRLLEMAHVMLRPGGLLLLTVPRQGSFTADGTLTAWLERHGYQKPVAQGLGFALPLTRAILLSAQRSGG